MSPTTSPLRPIIGFAVALSVALPLNAQTPPKAGSTQSKPAPRRPGPAKPAPATKAPEAPKAAEPAPPPKPAPQDLRMKTSYTTGAQRTETTTFFKGPRQRFEFGDMVVIRQTDLNRTLQVSQSAKTYMVVADGASPVAGVPAPPTSSAAPAKKPGVVNMTTTITDTSERKTAFNLQARHVKTTIDRQPQPGACDSSKQHIETDGWYVDLPLTQPPSADAMAPKAPAEACVDEVNATLFGDAKALGFPISYSTTIVGDDGKSNVVSMEVSELDITTLDAALFDVPAGMAEAGNIAALSKALSDATEKKLADDLAATPSGGAQKRPGVPLIGVTDVVNKTTQQVDTRALRQRLVTELTATKTIDAAPLAGDGDLVQLAASRGYDYVLSAEITDLKVSKSGGGLGGVLKTASKVVGPGSGQDPTEAAITYKLVQPDGKARVSSNAKGKEGGFDMKSGLNLAKFGASMYFNMMSGRMMMNALNMSTAGNLGGMGLLGNPAMMSMQARGLGSGMGGSVGPGARMMGLDPTAGAASFLMQQAMSSGPGVGQPGTSFDGALGDAVEHAAKTVVETLKKPEGAKK